jgi:hypothetical protein
MAPALAAWLPVRAGLTPHGFRHSHKTWMIEDRIPEILAETRLGHEVPGMRGLYSHVSDQMRQELKDKLQARALLPRPDAERTPDLFWRPGWEDREPLLPNSSQERFEHRSPSGLRPSHEPLTCTLMGGRYWVRTSDLLGVNEALYH